VKPSTDLARSTRRRQIGFQACRSRNPPQFGSGIAAKQYDPGAPFFWGYWLPAIGYRHCVNKRPSWMIKEGLCSAARPIASSQ
jgi:hypothetical protein